MSKILVAYFSYSGTTKRLADKIAQMTGSDIFEIETVDQYPAGYNQVLEVSRKEQAENARPELVYKILHIEDYDTVVIGYPNWYNTCPMPVLTFLKSHDLTGKIIAPFCTHGGSRMGNSERDIKKSCPNSRVLPGYASGLSATKELEKWVDTI